MTATKTKRGAAAKRSTAKKAAKKWSVTTAEGTAAQRRARVERGTAIVETEQSIDFVRSVRE
jgi:hypothetical protein